MIWGLKIGVWGLGAEVWGLGLGVQGGVFREQSLGLTVLGLEFRD